MKRTIAVIVTIILLVQALPVSAATGDGMTSAELASALSLAGLTENAGQYHAGMKPLADWNAKQLIGWLDDMLSVNVHSVCNTLARVETLLVRMQDEDANAYTMLAGDEEGLSIVARCRELYLSAESDRQDLRFRQDRLNECVTMISNVKDKLESSDVFFDYELARYTEALRLAAADIVKIRGEIADNADAWTERFDHWQKILSENADNVQPEIDRQLGGWVRQLFLWEEGPQTETAAVTGAGTSVTRMSRLTGNTSLLVTNNAKITVRTQNQISLQLNGEDKMGVPGLKVRVRDARNGKSPYREYTTDLNGAIVMESSAFQVDDLQEALLDVQVEAEEKGYRSFSNPSLTAKAGSITTYTLTKLNPNPYVYSVTFQGHDIFTANWEMLYAAINDMEFDIVVKVVYPSGSKKIPPVMGYYAPRKDDFALFELVWAEPTGSDGDTYTFRGAWKSKFVPMKDTQKGSDPPFFTFDRNDEKAERFPTQLKSVNSMVEKPMDYGTDAFKNILGEGLSFSATIPVLNVNVGVDLPFKKYLPKVILDPAGCVTVSIGAQEDETKTDWKSASLKDYTHHMQSVQKVGYFAQQKSQAGAAYDYYKSSQGRFLGKATADFGFFFIAGGRWQRDKDNGSRLIALNGGAGCMLKCSIDMTWTFTIGPVPVYLNVNFGASASVGFSTKFDMIWVNGAFKNCKWYPLREMTILIRVSGALSLGVGIKGVASIWARGNAYILFRIVAYFTRPMEFGVYANATVDVGLQFLFFTGSKTVWNLKERKIWPTSGDGMLDYYMASAGEGLQEAQVATQEPQTYPELVPEVRKLSLDGIAPGSDVQYVYLHSNEPSAYWGSYALYIANVKAGDGRVRRALKWQSITYVGPIQGVLEMSGNDQTAQPDLMRDYQVYAFDTAVCSGDPRVMLVAALGAEKLTEDGLPDPTGKMCLAVWQLAVENGTQRLKSGIMAYWPQTSRETPLKQFFCELKEPYAAPKITYYQDFWQSMFLGLMESPADSDGVDAFFAGSSASYEHRDGICSAVYSRIDQMGTWVSGFRDDYERVYMQPALNRPEIRDGKLTGCSWLAVTAPKEGAEGIHAIEIWDQNQDNQLYNHPEVSRRTAVLDTLNGNTFQVIQNPGDAERERIVFYTDKVEKDGMFSYRLKGLTLEKTEVIGAEKGNLNYHVTRTDYDITLPTDRFRIQQIDGVNYLYWVAVPSKEKEEAPDLWRFMGTMYDQDTNAMSDVYVLAEITLPEKDLILRDVTLGTNGNGYFAAGPEGETPTHYEFRAMMKPMLELQTSLIEDTVVCAGDFDDVSLTVMNTGNMAVSTFDVDVVVVENGQETVVETLHADLGKPEKSSLTMEGETIVSGEKAFYRKEDYAFTPRQRDWLKQQEKKTHVIQDHEYRETKVEETQSRYIKSKVLMPGALALMKGAIKIPGYWSGEKTIGLRLKKLTCSSKWISAVSGEANEEELVYVRDPATGSLMLQHDRGGETPSIYTASLNSDTLILSTGVHDISATPRVYKGPDGQDMLDITLLDFAMLSDSVKLSCAVYVDDEEEPFYLNLPYSPEALASGKTQTITLPLAALADPAQHERVRVAITTAGIEESVLANNEFIVYLNGVSPLTIIGQPQPVTVAEGETAVFSVEAAGGKKPYAYQWQTYAAGRWTDVPGVREVTLTLENVQRDMNGRTVRCIVTDAAGNTAASLTAALTVQAKGEPIGPITGDESQPWLLLGAGLAALSAVFFLYRKGKKHAVR